jgi:hypothetical protein
MVAEPDRRHRTDYIALTDVSHVKWQDYKTTPCRGNSLQFFRQVPSTGHPSRPVASLSFSGATIKVSLGA